MKKNNHVFLWVPLSQQKHILVLKAHPSSQVILRHNLAFVTKCKFYICWMSHIIAHFFAIWSITNQILIYLHPFFAWGRKIRKTWIIEAWTLMNKSKNEQKIHVLPSKFSRKRLKIKSSCTKFLHLSSPLMYLLVKYSQFMKLN